MRKFEGKNIKYQFDLILVQDICVLSDPCDEDTENVHKTSCQDLRQGCKHIAHLSQKY